MQVLVLGASGATGRLVVEQLLEAGHSVKILLRPRSQFPAALREHPNLHSETATVLYLEADDLLKLLDGCRVVVSCLGHNPSFKGIFGKPRRLVTKTMERLLQTSEKLQAGDAIKFILMSSVGVSWAGNDTPLGLGERIPLGILRRVLPPHADNEQAAASLANLPATRKDIEWCVVRSDTLTNDQNPPAYEVAADPRGSALFNPGKTSRPNVARFMVDLIENDQLWQTWRNRMPVVYDSTKQAV